MKILSVDISKNHFGYAIFVDEELIFYKAVILPKSKYGKGQEYFIYSYFDTLLKQEKPDIITSEEFYCGFNKSVYGILQLVQGILLCLSFIHNAKMNMLHISTYRKAIGIKKEGKENIKDAVVRKVLEIYPDIIVDKEKDICDAVALGLAQIKLLQGTTK